MPGTPFLGEIRAFSFSFPPRGWAMCNGQLLPINQNQALYSLLGIAYGGNGQTNFALPNLQGRTVLHYGNGHHRGETAGEAAHTLTQNELPTHIHVLNATTNAATVATPGGNLLATVNNQTFGNAYALPASLVPLASGSITTVGGSQPHQNEMPYLVLNFCIALQGFFPTRN